MDQLHQLTPRRPYLLRAFYYWLLDNKLMPHLVIDVKKINHSQVPLEYARNGQIILNISPRAVDNLEITNDQVYFKARFRGVTKQVFVPMAAIVAIYARENGAGTMFEPESVYELISQDENKKIMYLVHKVSSDTVTNDIENSLRNERIQNNRKCSKETLLYIVK